MSAVPKIEPKNILDVSLSEEDFKKLHLTEIENNSWLEVEFEGEFIGFAKADDIKELKLENTLAADSIRVRLVGAGDFQQIFSHPLFQRRRPQLVSAETLKNDVETVYLLKHGQKVGPYPLHELQTMIKNREILATDLVSVDGGVSFIKIFEIDGFDRRHLHTTEDLPVNVSKEVTNINIKIDMLTKDTDAMASLAFLGQMKAGKQNDRLKEEKLENELKEKETKENSSKYLVVAMILGLVYAVYSGKKIFTGKTNSEADTTVSEQMTNEVEVLKPVGTPIIESGNGSVRSNPVPKIAPENNRAKYNPSAKFESRNMRTGTIIPSGNSGGSPKSFDQSSDYNRQINSDTTAQFIEPADNYYDDNPPPIELDPVQSQVSKEIYDAPANDDNAVIPPSEPAPKANAFDRDVAN